MHTNSEWCAICLDALPSTLVELWPHPTVMPACAHCGAALKAAVRDEQQYWLTLHDIALEKVLHASGLSESERVAAREWIHRELTETDHLAAPYRELLRGVAPAATRERAPLGSDCM